jgi:hypothetical protein
LPGGGGVDAAAAAGGGGGMSSSTPLLLEQPVLDDAHIVQVCVCGGGLVALAARGQPLVQARASRWRVLQATCAHTTRRPACCRPHTAADVCTARWVCVRATTATLTHNPVSCRCRAARGTRWRCQPQERCTRGAGTSWGSAAAALSNDQQPTDATGPCATLTLWRAASNRAEWRCQLRSGLWLWLQAGRTVVWSWQCKGRRAYQLLVRLCW